jgi:hypothetical protein
MTHNIKNGANTRFGQL